MTDASHGTSTDAEHWTRAVDALTAAARGVRVVGRGTDREHEEPVDFADLLVSVVTAVAANLGGVDQLLSGRSGSWEADLVRQMVGHDARALLVHRTEPLPLYVDLDDIFEDFGLADLYEEARTALDEEWGNAHESVFEENATADQRSTRDSLVARVTRGQSSSLMDEGRQLAALYRQVRDSADGPAVARLEEAERRSSKLELNYSDDRTAYLAAFQQSVHEILAQEGLGGVPVAVGPIGRGSSVPDIWQDITDDIFARALSVTAIPGLAAPPAPGLSPADQLRAAGARYIDRVRPEL